ncbi:type III-A CRISPR-associated RAMP protein Csm5 [Candidatus Albibeggiatoa sp. nov. BB20]|uniref:type III-A CRISPR-associated RAMP protein Csm5 n=1 Tax=Candidatus Albibeggiatoa sp. nov. BB20 TaxID=3162723 RepID=UPI00336579EB
MAKYKKKDKKQSHISSTTQVTKIEKPPVVPTIEKQQAPEPQAKPEKSPPIKNTKKYQNQTTTHVVEILTPVHVGTGETLIRDADFLARGQNVIVPDQQYLFNQVEEMLKKDSKLAEIVGNITKLNNLTDIVDDYKGGYGYQLQLFAHSPIKEINEIREQIKDGFWHPIIPGSSLKGAMRTALLSHLIEQQGFDNIKHYLPKSRGNPATADNRLLENLFSSSPNNSQQNTQNLDFLRSLHVSDIQFKTDNLNMMDVRWLNLAGNPLKAKWKVMGRRDSIDVWQDATGIVAEALAPSSEASLTLQIDDFLLHNPQAQQVLNWNNELIPQNFEQWREILNNHAQQHLTKEITFFHQYGATAVEQECQNLLKHIKQDTDAAYIRVGWGNGWNGMTGDWLDEVTENEMRTLYNLGKTGVDEFPKTRRLVVKNQPCLPFGWLRILSVEMSKQRLQEMAEQEIQAQNAVRLAAEQEKQAQQEAQRLAQEEAKLTVEQRMIRDVEKCLQQCRSSGDTSTNGVLSDALSKAINQALAGNWVSEDRECLAHLAEEVYTFQDKPSKNAKVKRKDKLQKLRQ